MKAQFDYESILIKPFDKPFDKPLRPGELYGQKKFTA